MNDAWKAWNERERRAVEVMGERMGFGRIMQLAHQIWNERQPGMAHVKGPCDAETVRCDHNGAEGHKCDWCAGAGWVTKRVSEAMKNADALKRGRITQEHAEMVTPEMLATYLNGSDRWTWHEADDDYREHWRIGDDLHGRVCPGDAHKWAIQNIAHKENRGELAVWCEVMREGE